MAASLPFGVSYAQSPPPGLTVHTLDTTIGQPAAGLAVELFDVSEDQPRSIVKVTANSDGRADIVIGRPLPAGRYELQFAVADYFRKRGTPLADPPFLDIVPVRFFIDQPAGNLHMPFAFSPWSYGVFR
jgi:hydroxyisourate hydrolase